MATRDEGLQRDVLRKVAGLLSDLPPEVTPVEVGFMIHQTIREVTGALDLYRELKDESNRRALSLYPRLRAKVEASADPLEAAVRIAAIGNVMDFGANPHFDLERSIAEGLSRDLVGCGFRRFADAVKRAGHVLYVGDNAGEVVFDRLLVERLARLGVSVTFAVRGAPILNDATMDDARAVGMDEVAEVISTGVVAPGLILDHAHSSFLDCFRRAELILVKGQGNYESLSDEPGPVFFLLMAKCAVVARDLGVEVGDLVMRGPAGSVGHEPGRSGAGSKA